MSYPSAKAKYVEWKPQEGSQTEALSRSEKEILLAGTRGSAKTETGLAWLCEPEYIEHPEYRSLVIRRNYDDLNDWIFRARSFYSGIGDIVGVPAKIRWKGGGETVLGHWKDKDTISKYLGHEYSKILVEEMTQSIGTLDEYKMLMGSCRSKVLRAQFLGTTNPGGKGHKWIKSYFVDKCYNKPYKDPVSENTRICIPSSYKDNKILCAKDPEYIKWLEGLDGPLGLMWRDGSWDVFEGQFFENIGDPEPCFSIQQSDLEGRLFASLDGGTTHATSFGLWWVDHKYQIHRIFSYCNRGSTHRDHAIEIFNRIESCEYTKGYFPEIMWADPALWTNVKLNEQMVRSPIDEYKDVFAKWAKKTQIVKANNSRINGCQIMKALFKGQDGVSQVKYFDVGNRSYVDGLQLVMTDKDSVEEYLKMTGDDETDESRYGLVGCYSFIAQMKQAAGVRQPPTKTEQLIRSQRIGNRSIRGDWYNL
jgi:hypothetical protein